GELKQKYEQVDKQFQPRYQQLQTVENQLKTMESESQTKCPQWTEDKCKELQANYAELKKRGPRDYEDLKAEYERAVETATKPVRDKHYHSMNKYARMSSILMV